MNLKEYYTPDRIKNSDNSINYRWDYDNAYPFLVYQNKIIIGQQGEKHYEMSQNILLRKYGISLDSFDDIINDNYWYDADEGSIVTESGDKINMDIVDTVIEWQIWFQGNDNTNNPILEDTKFFGRVWANVGNNGESYISVWLNNRLDWNGASDNFEIRDSHFSNDGTFDVGTATNNLPWEADNYVKNSLSEQELNWMKDILIKTNCELNNSFICLGNTITPFMDVYSKKRMNLNQNDIYTLQQQGKILHTLPPKEKWEKLQDFRNTRDEKNGKMLGNMTMAQYHSLIRQECKKYINKIIKENINHANIFTRR